jgi:hypothetical protein
LGGRHAGKIVASGAVKKNRWSEELVDEVVGLDQLFR